jgi:hypothetical protein
MYRLPVFHFILVISPFLSAYLTRLVPESNGSGFACALIDVQSSMSSLGKNDMSSQQEPMSVGFGQCV